MKINRIVIRNIGPFDYLDIKLEGQSYCSIKDLSRPGNFVKFSGNKAFFWKECLAYPVEDYLAFIKLFKPCRRPVKRCGKVV